MQAQVRFYYLIPLHVYYTIQLHVYYLIPLYHYYLIASRGLFTGRLD
jgi:hypothetical protein